VLPVHSLLRRQLKRFAGVSASPPEEWRGLFEAVNEAYRQFDEDRAMLERTLELSSHELLQANSEMRAVFQALPDLFFRLDRDGAIVDCRGGSPADFFIQPQELLGKRIWDVPRAAVGHEFRLRSHV
jgi:PAS domain-containing protein